MKCTNFAQKFAYEMLTWPKVGQKLKKMIFYVKLRPKCVKYG